MVLSRLNSWKGVEWTSHMFTASKNRDSAWGIWRISWWVIASLMPSILRICVSKAWESKMWSRLCYTYIYVDATPSITEASLSLYAAVKNQSSTQTWGIQHAMRSLTLTICCFIPWDSLPQCTAQVRHGCLERLKSTQLKSPHSWPLHVKSTSTQNIAKHPLFSKDVETTWKKTQLCYFSDYLHFTLWNCPWYLYQHSRWACPARGSLYHIDSSLTAQCRLQSTGRGASCWQLHLSLPHPPTSCSMRLVLARHFSDFVWITSLWCPSVTLMVYSPHKVSICPRMLGIIDS